MDAFADEGVREITCKCSAQSAKTETLLALVAWIIAEDPGPILWVTKSIVEAKKLMKTRLRPLLEMCKPVMKVMPQDKSLNTLLEIYFPGASLIITGSESEASLQSTPYRYVIMDEARSYPKGAVEMASKRLRSFTHSGKRIIISTPSKEDDVVDRNYRAGNQQEIYLKCPSCGDDHKLDWGEKHESGNGYVKGGLHWDTVLDSEGCYDFDALLATVRYECWNGECERVWVDEMRDRKAISRSAYWVETNPSAPSYAKSYTWNALLPYWAGWKDQVREFLEANAALEFGDYHPLKDHINETRGQDWTDRHRFGNDEDEAKLKARARKYDPKDKWDDEITRYLAIDVQGKGGRHYKYVLRSWGYGSKSRLLTYGVAWSVEELKEIISEWNVPPDNVALDSGKWTKEIYQLVVESGYRWKALKGDDKHHFAAQGVRKLFSVTMADPALGTAAQERVRPLELYMWAKYGVLDQLFAYMSGTVGDWQVFDGIDDKVHDGYVLEVTAKGKRDRKNRAGELVEEYYNKRVDDHWSDCEQMQIVCASASGLLDALPLFAAGVEGVRPKVDSDESENQGVFDEAEQF